MVSREETFGNVVTVAAKLPGVKIDRARYLRSALARECSAEQREIAVESGLAAAGIPPATVEKIARAAIAFEATKVSALSVAAGIPGGFALLATIPADGAQYFAHMMRISQKLAYLYDWPELVDSDADDIDDDTKNVLILFIGVMFGTQAANGAVTKLATAVAGNLATSLPKQALTKGVVFPVVRSVAKQVGVRMTIPMFAQGVAKIVPVVGGVVNGGVTLATFTPMSHRLRKHLAASAALTDEQDLTA